MGGNARFGHFVHLASSDLHLDPFAIAARHCGMNRPVAVVLGLTDVVFKPPRHRPPPLVNDTDDTVTIGFVVSDNAKAVNVGQARKRQILFLHLAPDRIGLFRATKNISLYLCLFQFRPDIGGDLVHHIAAFAL